MIEKISIPTRQSQNPFTFNYNRCDNVVIILDGIIMACWLPIFMRWSVRTLFFAIGEQWQRCNNLWTVQIQCFNGFFFALPYCAHVYGLWLVYSRSLTTWNKNAAAFMKMANVTFMSMWLNSQLNLLKYRRKKQSHWCISWHLSHYMWLAYGGNFKGYEGVAIFGIHQLTKHYWGTQARAQIE